LIADRRTTTQDPWVAQAISGDRRAMDMLWQSHRRWVAAVLLTYKPSDVDLEDLLQETAMRLVSKIDTLREESNVRAWLRAVAVNVARSAGRRSGRVQSVEPEELDALPGEDPAIVDPEARRMMALLATLPDRYREPLVLRAVHGMKTRQIAESMDLPPATIDTRIARARRMLRERMDRQATGRPGEWNNDWETES
jgi:RNA polymerase sigma factor (sigma-70 family)